jgi:hypothetical protein
VCKGAHRDIVKDLDLLVQLVSQILPSGILIRPHPGPDYADSPRYDDRNNVSSKTGACEIPVLAMLV